MKDWYRKTKFVEGSVGWILAAQGKNGIQLGKNEESELVFFLAQNYRKVSSKKCSLTLKQHKNRKRARFAMMKREARDDGIAYVCPNKKGHV